MKAVIVFYDSLNKRYLPPYNSECDTIAPNFSRLAERSVKFDNSYVGSMPCMPARRELHTGRYNFLHREWGPLEPFDDSMPEILRNNGVYTHLISDHLHYWEDGGSNYHTRYSSWECFRGQEGDHWKGVVGDVAIPPVVKVPQNQQGNGIASGWKYDWVNRNYIKVEDDFPQTKTFNAAVDFIRTNHDSDNWLLQVETFDPHEPFYAPKEYLDLYPEDYDGKHFDWPRGKSDETSEEIKHCQRNYKALVSMCDHNLGKILDEFDKYDLWKDTMLIVGTDHGFLLSEHGYWGKNKMPYYDEIANTPLFIYDPRLKKFNETRNALVQMIDWAPTLLSYFQQPIPKDMLGKDLYETIKDDKKVRDYALYGTFSGQVNITDGHTCYMCGAVSGKENEVYNYTLMPSHMTSRFSIKELSSAEYVDGFSFTKGLKLLKVKSKDKYGVAPFGSALYDLDNDPNQLKPIEDKELETRMKEELVKLMKENDAPKEQYERLGIEMEHN
ncbi:MAG: sulfatase [Erysipelotrichaceae bacterium]|nr:sulfatase [Erysipelotrichaceae bacterium]